MFGFVRGTGSSSSSTSNVRDSRLDIPAGHPIASLDGPPSPELLRALSDSMRRGSMLGRPRSNTSSSGTFSLKSGESGERAPSRKSSIRAGSVAMARPESVNLFSKTIFSRHRKSSVVKGSNQNGSNSGPNIGIALGGINEIPSAREVYYGKPKHSRKGNQSHDGIDCPLKPDISGPYNFQHITHTHKEHLPSLEEASGNELVSQFSAIRASQIPTRGALKGIKAEELHIDDFPTGPFREFSELSTPPGVDEWARPRTSPDQRASRVPRKSSAALHTPPIIVESPEHNQPWDKTPPPRPPRSPLSPECPLALPPRVSSRTTSGYFDAFLRTEELNRRPHTSHRQRGFSNGGSTNWEQAGQFAVRDLPARPLVSPPNEVPWPLTSSCESFGELAKVPEEEEKTSARRRSNSLQDVQWTKSAPDLHELIASNSPRLEATEQEMPIIGSLEDLSISEPSPTSQPVRTASPSRRFSRIMSNQPLRPASPSRRFSRVLRVCHDDWEDLIDYCYEHEAEADCFFEWKRPSVDANAHSHNQPQTPFAEQSPFAQQSTIENNYFATSPSPKSTFPALLVPSRVDEVPELSPMSTESTEPEIIHTPSTNSGSLHPDFRISSDSSHHVRSPSLTSTFKEAQGFTLSPSLLIPNDFASQMEQDQLYEKLYNDHHSPTVDMSMEPFIFNASGRNRESLVIEGSSARSSFRSSGFSRGSVSFRSSNLSKNNSQESMVLLSRTSTYGGALDNGHTSVQSLGSLPELVVSSRRQGIEEEMKESEDSIAGIKDEHDEIISSVPAETENQSINDLLRERELYAAQAEEFSNNNINNPLTSPKSESSFTVLSPVKERESFESQRSAAASFEDNLTMLVPPRNKLRSYHSASNIPQNKLLQSHERKISAPVLSLSPAVRERSSLGNSGRHRSASIGPKYNLFPTA